MVPKVRPLTNLDIRCAEAGQQLSDIKGIDEKVLNEALAVLEEQGPYAMFLYIKVRHKGVSCEFQRTCMGLLENVFGQEALANKNKDALQVIAKLADDLDDLLFARDLLRNALGYARYHLKAKAE